MRKEIIKSTINSLQRTLIPSLPQLHAPTYVPIPSTTKKQSHISYMLLQVYINPTVLRRIHCIRQHVHGITHCFRPAIIETKWGKIPKPNSLARPTTN